MKKDFFKSVARLNPDILLLQETKLQQDQRAPEMIDFPPYESFWAYATVKKRLQRGGCVFKKETQPGGHYF